MLYRHEQREKKDYRPRVGALMPRINHDLWSMMETYLESRGLDAITAKKAGWYPSNNAGDQEARIVIPATNTKGLAYWQARAMGKAVEPRYQSPSVPRGDSVITVYPLAKDWLPILIVCEGPMDALAAASGGIRAVALMGMSPTEDTMDMLAMLTIDVAYVTFFCDRDAVPETITLVQRCLKRGIGMTISSPDPYKDLAAIPKKKRDVILNTYTAHCLK